MISWTTDQGYYRRGASEESLSKTDSDSADLYIGYQVELHREAVHFVQFGLGYGPGCIGAVGTEAGAA